ncbi:hypothetical protein HanOQP8_Chr02g0085141 [Helianthus annuus]|nr:hypothetical protein HanOQP8_Chr02g0085141 [Helianthus annuus]
MLRKRVGEVEENGNGGRGYTEDGTVDLRGNPILRSKRGGWKACSFVVEEMIFWTYTGC